MAKGIARQFRWPRRKPHAPKLRQHKPQPPRGNSTGATSNPDLSPTHAVQRPRRPAPAHTPTQSSQKRNAKPHDEIANTREARQDNSENPDPPQPRKQPASRRRNAATISAQRAQVSAQSTRE